VIVDVVGGSGFIGTRLLKRLNQRLEVSVRNIDKAESREFSAQTTIADVRELGSLRAAVRQHAVVVNLAAEHRDDVKPRTLYDDVNVSGARNICTVARERNVQAIVFTSSVAVYGFAEPGTGEDGAISPFNDYGRTKYEAEQEYKRWQLEEPDVRSLVIIRPTVIFGEGNRGNVFNLMSQIVRRRFVMVGNGHNRKSIAYVENIAAFVEFVLSSRPGVHVYNFTDKPDFSMNEFVKVVRSAVGLDADIRFRIPRLMGYVVARGFDIVAHLTGKSFAISSVRVKKFCADSVYSSRIDLTGFKSPVPLEQALRSTLRCEFQDIDRIARNSFTE
jgi:GlcNAc-P-P-Und epimerase